MNTDQHREKVRQLASDFINRTGMAPADFAARLGYGMSTLQLFLAGKYSYVQGARLTNAILEFLATNPLGEVGEFTGTIYETGAVRVVREAIASLLKRPQIFMMYAPPGSGKTDIVRHVIQDYNRQHGPTIFRIYCRTCITPRDLMRRVSHACGTSMLGMRGAGSIERIIDNLRYDFRGRRVLLHFDEAQNLSIECIDTVRELLDEPPYMSLCFAGADDLEKTFSRYSESLERLHRRIIERIYLPSLTRDEAAGILRQELAEVAPHLDAALIQQQIDLATITVQVARKKERYLSVGRLMAAAREIRESAIGMMQPPADSEFKEALQ
jgi:DNA transposition AAA+ family ATPase